MTARALIVGLDGLDLGVVRALGAARLPTLHALMRRGAFAALESVQPPATLPNWTTFLTGVDPGVHGVFDFTTRRGYGVRFTAGTVRAAPTLFARLDALGLRCACIGFPATWPPERLERGIFVSGWDAPVAFEADRSFVWPPALYDAMRARFGPPRFDALDQAAADRPGWLDALPDALVQQVAQKTELAEWLLDADRWDAFAFYFGESDTASHYLWSAHDPRSPRRPEGIAPATQDGLARVYAALDEAVRRLVERAGGDAVEVTLLSDHGSGGASDRVVYLNRALADAGLLRFHRRGGRARAVAALKHRALRHLPPRVRERVFRLGGTALPSWLESQARFGAIDMDRTAAFSEELNYFPSVCLNLRGREPRGTVAPADAPAVLRDVEAALRALRDPFDGEPVVADVWRREELFEGPLVERAPDLFLELRAPDGYTYNLMPSGGAPAGTGPFRKLGAEECLGRKGRSLPGSHRPRGFFCAAGPRVAAVGEIDAHIADVSATLLERLGVAPPTDARGRVCFELLAAATGSDRAEDDDGGPRPARATLPGARPGTEASVASKIKSCANP